MLTYLAKNANVYTMSIESPFSPEIERAPEKIPDPESEARLERGERYDELLDFDAQREALYAGRDTAYIDINREAPMAGADNERVGVSSDLHAIVRTGGGEAFAIMAIGATPDRPDLRDAAFVVARMSPTKDKRAEIVGFIESSDNENENTIMIGRRHQEDLDLDKTVSRDHCTISMESVEGAARIRVKDHSSNGTEVIVGPEAAITSPDTHDEAEVAGRGLKKLLSRFKRGIDNPQGSPSHGPETLPIEHWAPKSTEILAARKEHYGF